MKLHGAVPVPKNTGLVRPALPTHAFPVVTLQSAQLSAAAGVAMMSDAPAHTIVSAMY